MSKNKTWQPKAPKWYLGTPFGGTNLGNVWILLTGAWNDAGVWDDNAVWNDG